MGNPGKVSNMQILKAIKQLDGNLSMFCFFSVIFCDLEKMTFLLGCFFPSIANLEKIVCTFAKPSQCRVLSPAMDVDLKSTGEVTSGGLGERDAACAPGRTLSAFSGRHLRFSRLFVIREAEP